MSYKLHVLMECGKRIKNIHIICTSNIYSMISKFEYWWRVTFFFFFFFFWGGGGGGGTRNAEPIYLSIFEEVLFDLALNKYDMYQKFTNT